MAWKKRTKKLMLFGGILVVAAGVAVVSLGSSNEDFAMIQADLAYLDEISEIVIASGRIQPQTKVDITSEVPAEIVRLFISEGDRVNRGRHLLLLDTVQYQSDAAQARFSLEEVTARAEAARTMYEKNKLEQKRQARLYEQQLTSETAFINAKFTTENALANYQATQAQIRTAQARLEKAEDNLSKTRITAPMDGVITYLSAEVGEIAQAQTSFTQGKTLMTIADLSVFEVEVDVDETEIAKVMLGDQAKIRVDAFRDTSFAGTVVEIGNSAKVSGQGSEDYATSFRVKVRFDETDTAIRPGMSATVDITTATIDEALLILYASLVTRKVDPDSAGTDIDSTTPEDGELMAAEAPPTPAAGDGDSTIEMNGAKHKKSKKIKKTGIFVVQDGQAKFVPITTGIADERNIAALTGVQPGDTIISGSFQTLRRLTDGDQVKIDQRSLDKMDEKDD